MSEEVIARETFDICEDVESVTAESLSAEVFKILRDERTKTREKLDSIKLLAYLNNIGGSKRVVEKTEHVTYEEYVSMRSNKSERGVLGVTVSDVEARLLREPRKLKGSEEE